MTSDAKPFDIARHVVRIKKLEAEIKQLAEINKVLLEAISKYVDNPDWGIVILEQAIAKAEELGNE